MHEALCIEDHRRGQHGRTTQTRNGHAAQPDARPKRRRVQTTISRVRQTGAANSGTPVASPLGVSDPWREPPDARPGRQQHLARRGCRGRAGQPHRGLVLLLDQRRLVQLTDLIAHVAELLLRSTERVNAAFDSIGPAASSVDRKRQGGTQLRGEGMRRRVLRAP